MSQNDDDNDPGRMLVYGVLGGVACWVVIILLLWALW